MAAPESEYEDEEYEYEDEEEAENAAPGAAAGAKKEAPPPAAAAGKAPVAEKPKEPQESAEKPKEEKLSWKERKEREKAAKEAEEKAARGESDNDAAAGEGDATNDQPKAKSDSNKLDVGRDVDGGLKSPSVEPGRQFAPTVSKTALRKQAMYGAGKPSKHNKELLMRSEGIIPTQAGTNKFASQKGMTGFGVPRDIVDKVKSENLAELTDEAKIASLKGSTWLQSGTNKFASQKGMTGMGAPRDVNYKTKGTGGASEVPEEKARLTDGIVPLQSGTNKLASQAGMTGMGMPRIVDVRKTNDQDRESQGFIHLQMGTNRFATQAGMTGFGMPRREVTKYKDEVRGEMPHDEGTISRQTSGWKEGANQSGTTGFGAFRNNTLQQLQNQDQRSQGLIPYQMGVNFLDSQAGKTAFGMPRRTFTAYVDDSHEELPMGTSLKPDVPFWSGMETDFANQTGMGAFGTPRDVRGEYVRRMW